MLMGLGEGAEKQWPGLGAGSPATAAARAGASTEQPNARESCAGQAGTNLGVQGKQQALWEPKDTHSMHQPPGGGTPSSCNALFRALNLRTAQAKDLKGSPPFSQERPQGGRGAERHKSETGTSCNFQYHQLEVLSHHTHFYSGLK